MSQSQLTLRGLDGALLDKIRQISESEDISINKATLRLLRKGAGLESQGRGDQRKRIGAALDRFIGTWSTAEADEVLDGIKSCEQIDPDFWR